MPIEIQTRYPTSIKEFRRGMIVRHRNDNGSYVVINNYGNHATAVDTVDICNPSEWEILEFIKT